MAAAQARRDRPNRPLPPGNPNQSPPRAPLADAKVDDLLQSGTKQIVLAVVAWLAHGRPPDSESRRRRNHEPPKTGIPKRKKTATPNRLSCKIEYLLRSNHGHSSIASEFFTGDYLERQVRRHRVGRSLSERCRVIL